MAGEDDAPVTVTTGELASVLQAMDRNTKLCLMLLANREEDQDQRLRPRKKYIHCRCLL